MASAFSDSLMASGGWLHLPWDLRNYKRYDHEICTRCWYSLGGTKSKKVFDITGPVCKLQTKIPKMPIFRNATSRHPNFTKYCRIVTIDVKSKPWKFQIDILKIDYSTKQSVKLRKMLLYKIQNYLENAKCVTPPNLLGDGISSISGHRPSLESLCSVELKTALYEGQTRDTLGHLDIEKLPNGPKLPHA